MKAWRLGALLGSAAIAWAGQLAAGDSGGSAQVWLERMSAAINQMTYQGTFVYVQDGDMVTMRVTHVAGEDGVRERLVSLSGLPREVLRDSNGVRWVLGEDRSVLADQAFNRSFLPQLPLDQQDSTESCYQLELIGNGRVAGQDVQGLKVTPNDAYRYGYALWLEERSGLPLKWELVAPDGRALARLMFTDLRVGSEVDLAELTPSSQLKAYRTVESQIPADVRPEQSLPRWQPKRLPPGFHLTAHHLYGLQGDSELEHLIYSDGMAAVSVYVESSDAPGGEAGTPAEATIRRLGTTHAFSRSASGAVITVIGDVPADTVAFIGNAVAPTND